MLDWLAQLLGLPRGLARAHRGHRVDRRRSPRSPRRATLRPGGVVYALRARELLGREGGAAPRARVPDGAGRRRVPDARRTSRSTTRPRSSRRSGTTSTTSVDPVPALADRCEEAGVWLHVDAAYAGSAAVCPELRWCLDGCDRADSIVVNPHKWLFTPMDCSALWTRRPEALHARVRGARATTSPRPRARSTCATTARRSAGASARSSSGRCCAATAARACRR